MRTMRHNRAGALLGAALLALACSDPLDAPGGPGSGPARLGKTAGGPSVTAAIPSSGTRGTVALDVTINGSGFDQGSQATWALAGVPNDKVQVNSTRYVSSTQLVANITIAVDAAVADYDILVRTSGGKQGIGSELFTVTYAVPIDAYQGLAINDAGQIAGTRGGSSGTDAILWDPTVGTILLAPNATADAIDESGTTVAGGDSAGFAVVWTSAAGPSGPWVATRLPSFGYTSYVVAVASDALGRAVLMSGSAWTGWNNAHRRPIVWTRTPSGWQATIDSVPKGGAWGNSINAHGMMVGMQGTATVNAWYWDSLGVATALQPLVSGAWAAAWSISADGTITVGMSNSIAVMWTRTLSGGVYGPWSGAIALEATTSLCGKSATSEAHAVNAAGTLAVGQSCGNPMAWRLVPGGSPVRIPLKGLGPPNNGGAYAINNAVSPLATGRANGSAVYWRNFF
jgi:hypothetical protein